jgi:ABC-2 type transport system permease protein
VIGTFGMPLVVFVILGRAMGGAPRASRTAAVAAVDLPVLGAILIAIGGVLSLVTIIAIYREGGILKRLRATPLAPQTILTAHVLVKLASTALTLALMVLAGRRVFPPGADVPVVRFTAALLFTTTTLLSLGFVIASVVPTARFAQPVGTFLLYPMVAVSGLFVPIEALPPAVQTVARVLPVSHAVSLLKGAWQGAPWSAHSGDIAALLILFIVCTAVSARIFRWE